MILLPAIDMKDGQCVRLKKGEFSTVSQVADSAVETAKIFLASGAKWVHMVDLDGARNGVRTNFPYISEVIRQSGLSVELGGGIKTPEDVDAVAGAGVARFVIGSAAVTHPEVVDYALDRYGDRVAVGIDCLNGRVRTAGWERDSGLSGLELALQMEKKGLKPLFSRILPPMVCYLGPALTSLLPCKKQ